MHNTPKKTKTKKKHVSLDVNISKKELAYTEQVLRRASLSLLRPEWISKRERNQDASCLANLAFKINQILHRWREKQE